MSTRTPGFSRLPLHATPLAALAALAVLQWSSASEAMAAPTIQLTASTVEGRSFANGAFEYDDAAQSLAGLGALGLIRRREPGTVT